MEVRGTRGLCESECSGGHVVLGPIKETVQGLLTRPRRAGVLGGLAGSIFYKE